MIPLLAGALSGGISLLGGLFGKKDAKKQALAQQRAEIEAWQRQEAAQRENVALQQAAHDRAFGLALVEAHRSRAEFASTQEANRSAVEAANEAHRASLGRVEANIEAVNARNRQLGEHYVNAPSVRIKEMMDDAERAGFNPLTWLRSGVASLYSKANDLAGYQMMSPEVSAQAFAPSVFQAAALPGLPTPSSELIPMSSGMPVLSAASGPGMGSMLTGALKDGFTSFMSESRYLDTQKHQRDLLDRQLAGIAKGKAAGSKTAGTFGFVPTTVSAGGKKEKDKPLLYGGRQLPKDKGTSDTQDFSDRYGEEGPMSWVIGPAVAYQDAKKGWKDKTFGEIMRDVDNFTRMDLMGKLPSFERSGPQELPWWAHSQRRVWVDPQ